MGHLHTRYRCNICRRFESRGWGNQTKQCAIFREYLVSRPLIVSTMQVYKIEENEDEKSAEMRAKKGRMERYCYVWWYRFCTLQRGEYDTASCAEPGSLLSRALTAKASVIVVFVLFIAIGGIVLPLSATMKGAPIYVDLRLVRAFVQGWTHTRSTTLSDPDRDRLTGNALLPKEYVFNVQEPCLYCRSLLFSR